MSDSTPEPQLPFASTIDKIFEAHYFLSMMLHNYHDPLAFRFNLNAFIQALRNVTFMLQSEDEKPEGFNDWYAMKQEAMRSDPLLRKFVEARNVIVKQQMLEAKSKCWMGLFRGRKLKLAIGGEVPPMVETLEYLEQAKAFAIGYILDAEHSAIGEQIGVERTWIVDAIGPDEVVTDCARALQTIGAAIAEAVALAGAEFDASFELPDLSRFRVLLESDVDPTLPEQWGW